MLFPEFYAGLPLIYPLGGGILSNKIFKQTVFFFIIVAVLIILSKAFYNFFILSDNLTEKEREWIRQQGTLIYAADRNAPPLRFEDIADGQYKGILIDYVNSLSLEIGANIELHPMLWEDALNSLAKGDTDLCDMFASGKRSRHYLFSKPIYNLRAVLAVPAGIKDINSLDDLNGKVMAMQKGDYASEYLSINFPAISQHYVDDLEEALLLLAEGKVDGTMGDEPVIFYQLDSNSLRDKIKVIEKPIYENQVVFAVSKSKPELVPILNKGIAALNKKGVLEKAQQKWFGISAPIVKPINTELVKRYISIFAIIIFVIIILMIIWNNSLKKQIGIRTKELEDSRNDLQIVFDGMTEFMLVLDRDNKVININTSFLSFINKDKSQVVGKKYTECLGVFSDFDFSDILRNTFEMKTKSNIEKYFQNEVYEVSTYPLLDTQDNISNVLVLIYNVTSEKISKNRLLQANKMVAIGELAAGIAHEIRNPLGIIRNHSFILRSSEGVNPAISTSLDYIDNAIGRVSRIIDNILNFSRISDKNEELVDMNKFIYNIMELQAKNMQKQSITYRIDCKENYEFLTNQESLKHILINLLSNAIDAIEENGEITVKAYPHNDGILIECIDSGVGIKQEDLERIFNPFYTSKGPDKGTGLGLYIAYNEVKKLKGDIYVESELGKGTKFKVYLPAGGKNIEGNI